LPAAPDEVSQRGAAILQEAADRPQRVRACPARADAEAVAPDRR
jgi:hypothetical protein